MTRYVGEVEVSRLTGLAVQTLRNWRFLGKGFRYVKIGRCVRYDLQEVLQEMEKRKIRPRNVD